MPTHPDGAGGSGQDVAAPLGLKRDREYGDRLIIQRDGRHHELLLVGDSHLSVDRGCPAMMSAISQYLSSVANRAKSARIGKLRRAPAVVAWARPPLPVESSMPAL